SCQSRMRFISRMESRPRSIRFSSTPMASGSSPIISAMSARIFSSVTAMSNFLSDQRCKKLRRSHRHAAAAGNPIESKVMLLARKICQRIGGKEGLDIELEGFARRHHAADMGIDAGDDQLVALARAHQGFEVRALERAVAMLD